MRQAIDSILRQTFTNFEFLIIDDGSQDESESIIKSYQDSRISYVKNEQNIGLPHTLNKGLQLASANFVARMDCDDISLPRRLERQLTFMKQHPRVALCGSFVKTIGNSRQTVWKYPTETNLIRCRSLFETQFAHPSIIINKVILANHHLQYEAGHAAWDEKKYAGAEDWGLWLRCSLHVDMANLAKILLLYRVESSAKKNKKREVVRQNIIKDFFHHVNIPCDWQEAMLHNRIGLGQSFSSEAELERVLEWLTKLKSYNDRYSLYSNPHFHRTLGERWFQACTASTSLGLSVLWLYLKNQNLAFKGIYPLKFIKFVVKCLVNWKLR